MMIKVGIVGLGFMAATHLKAYRVLGGLRIGAICSPSGRHLDGDFSDISGNLGGAEPLKLDMTFIKPCRVFADMLADPEIHMIDICAPTRAHPELAIAALKAGKHVLCEKPLARTSQLAREIVEVAKTSKGFFMPAMCLRFWPEWAWLKKAIDEKPYGEARDARFRRVAQPPGWGQKAYFDGGESGGALLDLHIHDTDFVQFCFGRPLGVYSTGYTKHSGAIDHVVTQYQIATGAIVHAEGSWAMTEGFGFNMAYTVNFENATADYDFARGPEALKLFQRGEPPRTINCEGGDGYQEELRHFLKSIETGKPPTIVTAAEALSAVEICEAEEKSIKSGTAVAL
ncbi:MAG TPA: Gfo/Idh/MocA family oxidoreductase [Verrucomicrobiae bacterium]|nr:Gfo/Idh/MocA family oxidoreductase [Verrucomicrobiae bacterium]